MMGYGKRMKIKQVEDRHGNVQKSLQKSHYITYHIISLR